MSVFSANSSSVTVNGEAIAGVQALDYRQVRDQGQIFALGSEERIAVHYGAMRVEGTATPVATAAGSAAEPPAERVTMAS